MYGFGSEGSHILNFIRFTSKCFYKGTSNASFEVLAAVLLGSKVFWDKALRRATSVPRLFEGSYFLHTQG
jgi:hypothetical protein